MNNGSEEEYQNINLSIDRKEKLKEKKDRKQTRLKIKETVEGSDK